MIRAALITLALTATPAFAQSIEEQVQTQLQSQGFTEIVMIRTLLGRLRIVASNDSYRRELILDPRTGAVLRDHWDDLSDDDDDDEDGVRVLIPRIGELDDDDDDDDDDNESDDDDDSNDDDDDDDEDDDDE